MSLNHRARLLLGAATLTAGMLLGVGPGLAQESPISGTMPVTASVEQTCEMGTINPLAFGVYEPGIEKSVQTTFTVNCNLPGTVDVELGDGNNFNDVSRRMISAEGNFLSYQLYSQGPKQGAQWFDPVPLQVNGVGTTMNVYGTVLGTSNQNAAVGEYSDSVTITVTF